MKCWDYYKLIDSFEWIFRYFIVEAEFLKIFGYDWTALFGYSLRSFEKLRIGSHYLQWQLRFSQELKKYRTRPKMKISQ
jgi:hypothetical protein